MEKSQLSPTKDDASTKQKNVDDWLPITSSRNAKWWYSAFHNVTAMVGAGVLSLPYAMSNLGWYISNLLSIYIKNSLENLYTHIQY